MKNKKKMKKKKILHRDSWDSNDKMTKKKGSEGGVRRNQFFFGD